LHINNNYMKPHIQTSLWSKRICFALLFFVIIMTKPAAVFGQVLNDYRTAVAAANFSIAANWQRFDGTVWVTAVTAPTAFTFTSGNTITIQTGQTATLNNITLTIASGVTLDVVGSLGFASTSVLNINGIILFRNTSATSIASFTGTSNTININGTMRTFNVNGFIGTNASLPTNITTTGNRISSNLSTTASYGLIGAANQGALGLPATVNNLLLSGSGTKSGLNATQTVTGNLTIESGVTLTAPATLNIAGNFTNNGTFTQGANTVVFNGTTAQTISGTTATTFNNLTISNTTTGVNASTNLTVNGVLNLGANPNANRGILELVQDYTGYAQTKYSTLDGDSILPVANFNSAASADNTNPSNNLNSVILFMGAAATTTGAGDVTGKIKRTHVFANGVNYSYGNANTTIGFTQVGSSTFPTALMVVSTIGTNGLHADKSNAVQRLYQVLQTEPVPVVTGTFSTLRFAYSDAGLNGNTTEDNLVLWDHHIPYNGATPHEHGKTANNITDNYVELSGHGLAYLAIEGSTTFTKYWQISSRELLVPTWLGAAPIGGSWTALANWSSAQIPTSTTNVIIQDAARTAADPILPATVALNSIEIQNGGILNGASSTITLTGAAGINGGTGTWINSGTFIPGTSTVIMNNAAASASGSTSFNNLTVSNALGLAANATVNVNGNLVLGTGVVTLNANSVLGLNGSSIIENTGSINAQNISSRVNIGGTSNLSIPANLFTGNIAFLFVNKTNTLANTLTLNNAFTVTNTIIGSGKIDRNSNNFTSTNCTNVLPGTSLLNTGGTGTFSCGVPIISGGTFTEIEINDDSVTVTENTTIGNLKLNTGKKLAIGLNKKLTITGEITGDGAIVGGETAEIEIVNAPATTTTLKLDQTSKSSKSLKNLVVSGGGALVVGDTIRVDGTITLSSGSVVNTSNVLVIPESGRVGNLSTNGGGSFTGTVIAELLIPGGRRAFRTIANPFSNNIDLRQLTDDIDITGTITSGNFANLTSTPTNNPSAYWLNSNIGSDISRFVPFTAEDPSTAVNNTWRAGQGVRVLVRGAKGEGLDGSVYTPSAVTIDLIGTMNDKNGSTIINLPAMDASNTGKWAIVSNPYISPIAFSDAVTSTNIANAGYFIWDVSLGTKGAYRPLNFVDINNLPKYTALFVRNSSPTAAAASITFTENVKTTTSSLTVFKTAKKINNSLAIDVKLDTFNLDAFTAIFDSSYKNEYDLNEDLDKFFNPDFNLFVSSNNKSLCIERRNFPRGEETFVLNSIFTEGGNYRFDFTRSDLPKAYDFYLVDQFAKKEILLTNNSIYSFDVDFANPDSKARYRFALIAMGKANSLGAVSRFIKQSYEVYPNPFNKDLTITVINAKSSNLTHYELYTQTGSLVTKGEIAQGIKSHTFNTDELANGVYFLNIIDADGVTTKKIIK
jgi:hypothetical protein